MTINVKPITQRSIYISALSLLIFIMMLSTQSMNRIKLMLLVTILVLSFLRRGFLYYTRNRFFTFVIIYVLYNIFSIVYGFVSNAPGALRSVTVLVLWPIVFTIIFYTYHDRDFIDAIDKTIIFSLVIITIMDILYLMSIYGVIPVQRELFLNLNLDYAGVASDHEFNSAHDTSYIYGVPYMMGRFIVENDIKKKRRYIYLIIPMVMIVFLMGRRSLLLIFFTFPIYAYLIRIYLRKERITVLHIRKRALLACVGLAVLMVGGIVIAFLYTDLSISYFMTNFTSGFDFGGGIYSGNIRVRQLYYLVVHWLEKPLFGHGAGSGIKEVVRDPEMPWAYELSYASMLYQRGLIGLLIFGILVYSIFRLNRKKTRISRAHYNCVFPHLVGIFSFLIANGTNPYLGKFSTIWFLFLPLALSSYGISENMRNLRVNSKRKFSQNY